jgi:hypothetical protein
VLPFDGYAVASAGRCDIGGPDVANGTQKCWETHETALRRPADPDVCLHRRRISPPTAAQDAVAAGSSEHRYAVRAFPRHRHRPDARCLSGSVRSLARRSWWCRRSLPRGGHARRLLGSGALRETARCRRRGPAPATPSGYATGASSARRTAGGRRATDSTARRQPARTPWSTASTTCERQVESVAGSIVVACELPVSSWWAEWFRTRSSGSERRKRHVRRRTPHCQPGHASRTGAGLFRAA